MEFTYLAASALGSYTARYVRRLKGLLPFVNSITYSTEGDVSANPYGVQTAVHRAGIWHACRALIPCQFRPFIPRNIPGPSVVLHAPPVTRSGLPLDNAQYVQYTAQFSTIITFGQASSIELWIIAIVSIKTIIATASLLILVDTSERIIAATMRTR